MDIFFSGSSGVDVWVGVQIGEHDTLIVGWENELASDELAYTRTYSRTAQLEQWAFMGAPGASHPPAPSPHLPRRLASSALSVLKAALLCLGHHGVAHLPHVVQWG